MIKVNIQKKFSSRDQKTIELKFECEIPLHQSNSLFGPSGAGKTTFLKMLTGLVKPDLGSIVADGQVWFDSEKNINLPIVSRSIGYLFQESSLFPNMNVRENLEFAFQKGKEDKNFLQRLMTTAEIDNLLNHKVEGLSGGQKQRVALVRSLIQKPKFLFLDEPFSSLDQRIRSQLVSLVESLQKQYQMTAILISHEIPEVIKLTKKVYMISNGEIVSSGDPIDCFRQKHHDLLEGEVIGRTSKDEVAIWYPNPFVVLKRNEKDPILKINEFCLTQIKIKNKGD
ncbi:ATP-binding cassette domain-containing protein [Leptospira bourretii]|uniref:ATP-binding cassette domain-containing protein n=1 Tax=Leptospira bourretii TaxID=2484962 RepID=A0A4R9IJR3_9LEPT|nr:ATP-binding cassette domain-containing protein [Leptospira bourretii]TGK88255.1 ATP-binding cassette domain-containing protein [Leptospira bourretii]TGK88905.1 ATP-binding cassette domain-containing protein [Leptospira bourretii]TGL21193.1 ATP-binding cassette domain-containing protein [Leptospira bourretii]TGL42860.1 ATP-binding cassette domain-containing protein [Leptospira bourretii]